MNEVQIDINAIKARLGDLEMQCILKDSQIAELQTRIDKLENTEK